jgi:hypothetical protein
MRKHCAPNPKARVWTVRSIFGRCGARKQHRKLLAAEAVVLADGRYIGGRVGGEEGWYVRHCAVVKGGRMESERRGVVIAGEEHSFVRQHPL